MRWRNGGEVRSLGEEQGKGLKVIAKEAPVAGQQPMRVQLRVRADEKVRERAGSAAFATAQVLLQHSSSEKRALPAGGDELNAPVVEELLDRPCLHDRPDLGQNAFGYHQGPISGRAPKRGLGTVDEFRVLGEHIQNHAGIKSRPPRAAQTRNAAAARRFCCSRTRLCRAMNSTAPTEPAAPKTSMSPTGMPYNRSV